MRRFDQLSTDDRLRLCIETAKTIGSAHVRNIHDAAEAREITTAELWREVCRNVGMDECEPWVGYPEKMLPADIDTWPVRGQRVDDEMQQQFRELQEVMAAFFGQTRRS